MSEIRPVRNPSGTHIYFVDHVSNGACVGVDENGTRMFGAKDPRLFAEMQRIYFLGLNKGSAYAREAMIFGFSVN